MLRISVFVIIPTSQRGSRTALAVYRRWRHVRTLQQANSLGDAVATCLARHVVVYNISRLHSGTKFAGYDCFTVRLFAAEFRFSNVGQHFVQITDKNILT